MTVPRRCRTYVFSTTAALMQALTMQLGPSDMIAKLSYAAKCNLVLHHEFPKALKAINPELSYNQIQTAFWNASSLTPPLLGSDHAIAILSRQLIVHLKPECLETVTKVYNLLHDWLFLAIDQLDIPQYLTFKYELKNVAESILDGRRNETLHSVEMLVDIEISHVATVDHEFRLSAAPLFDKLKESIDVSLEGFHLANMPQAVHKTPHCTTHLNYLLSHSLLYS